MSSCEIIFALFLQGSLTISTQIKQGVGEKKGRKRIKFQERKKINYSLHQLVCKNIRMNILRLRQKTSQKSVLQLATAEAIASFTQDGGCPLKTFC